MCDGFVWFLSKVLLETVVKKSQAYSVEELERLYSVLSQCIYQHRREYDKTQLLEVRRKIRWKRKQKTCDFCSVLHLKQRAVSPQEITSGFNFPLVSNGVTI